MPVGRSVVTLDGGTDQDHSWDTCSFTSPIVAGELLTSVALSAGQYSLRFYEQVDSATPSKNVLFFRHKDSTKTVIRNAVMGVQGLPGVNLPIGIVDVQEGDFFVIDIDDDWPAGVRLCTGFYYLKLD